MRGSCRMAWKYDNCRCGYVETDMYVLIECTLYGKERERWRGVVGDLKDSMDEYEIIKEYHVRSHEIETMRYMRVMWNSWQRHETMNWIRMIGNSMHGSEVEKDVIFNVDG